MKKIGKILLWILGILAWFMFFTSMWEGDINNGTHTHPIILIITGVCLALYIFRKTGTGAKELEKENQKLRAENQQLRQELNQAQVVQRVIDKTEQKKSEEAKK